MTRINCRSVRREIEEAAPGEMLSSVAGDHMKNCVECGTFNQQHLKLQKMVSSLGTVEAPGDFDFRLRARLAGEKRGTPQPFAIRNRSVGFRSAAFVTVLLLIGSALLFVSLRTPVDNSQSAGDMKFAPRDKEATAGQQPRNDGQQNAAVQLASGSQGAQASVIDEKPKSSESPERRRNVSPRPLAEQVASVRNSVRNKERQRTRDLSSTQAAVFRPTEQVAQAGESSVFPIDASYQSLRFSFDDGRGSARTISLPKVSFGSQRVLSPTPSALAPRGSW